MESKQRKGTLNLCEIFVFEWINKFTVWHIVSQGNCDDRIRYSVQFSFIEMYLKLTLNGCIPFDDCYRLTRVFECNFPWTLKTVRQWCMILMSVSMYEIKKTNVFFVRPCPLTPLNALHPGTLDRNKYFWSWWACKFSFRFWKKWLVVVCEFRVCLYIPNKKNEQSTFLQEYVFSKDIALIKCHLSPFILLMIFSRFPPKE